jgi:hypothetical protein
MDTGGSEAFSTMTIFLFIFAAIICGIVYVATTVNADLLTLAIALAGVLLILGAFALVEKAYELYARRKFFRKMKVSGKFMDWTEVAAKLASGEGSAVICRRIKLYDHAELFWQPEGFRKPDQAQGDGKPVCYRDGLGFLTKCPRRLLNEKSLRREFPRACVINEGRPTTSDPGHVFFFTDGTSKG